MKKDKFLIGIIIGIIALVTTSVVVFLTRQNTALTYQADDQPQGVVFNYLLALDKGEYEKAYVYLAEIPNKPSLTQFRQSMAANQVQFGNAVKVTDQQINGQTATVSVVTQSSGGGLFNDGYQWAEAATLEKVDGKWQIISMPYTYWSYDWNQPEFKE
jgi:ABC-type nitrate/sulfonate/bicarbonate transport system substrate-binding protein